MKKAKVRTPPILAQLVSSTRRAKRAICSAVAYVAKSNRRLAKHKPGKLEQLMAEMPEALDSVEKLRGIVRKPETPVSIEAMNNAGLSKVVVDAAALKAMIDEGRD